MVSIRFTIIIPTYNRQEFLPRAIDSVLAQNYTSWELIVIDDGSTDNTNSYISGLKNPKIRYYYQNNKGRSAARNLGIDKAKGDYICFLDSDDELLQNYLQTFYLRITKNNSLLLLVGVRLQDNASSIEIVPSNSNSICIKQCLEGNFNLMPFCFHKSLVATEGFKNELYYGEDFHFFIPIISRNEITTIESVTCIVHQHKNRTINIVFQNIDRGYNQLKESILNTIEENRVSLLIYLSEDELEEIKENKVKDFILRAAKYNYLKTLSINNKQNIVYISNVKLLFQRIKGIIQLNKK